MIVVTLTDCPPALRGDLTKWLQEINTGVYVGQVSARVRDEIWHRIRENTKTGKATMVFNANNEQGMDFRVHNTSWEPIDFDGLKLMLRPSPARASKLGELRLGFSKAAAIRKAKQISRQNRGKTLPVTYLVVDVETTGLSPTEHEMIEIGAIKVVDSSVAGEFHAMLKSHASVPESIQTLTGICDELLEQEGRELSEVMPEFLQFAGDLPIVSHNVTFDFGFLRSACERCGLPLLSNRCVDTLDLARRLIDDAADYRLATLRNHLGIAVTGSHRCIEDCMATKQLYEKLNEMHRGKG